MADTPEQPEGGASPQDLDLEAQLDSLLTRLEETDRQSVPADLRKHPPEPKPAEPVAETPKPEAVSQEAASEEVAAQEPVAQAADAEAAQPQPVTAGEPAIAQDATQDAAQDVAQDTAQHGGQPSGQAGEAVISDEPQPVAATVSDLLDQQIDDTIDAATAPTDPGSDSVEPQTPAQPPEPAEAQAGSGSTASLSEDDLASQIQGLLNEVQEKGMDAIPPGEPDGAPEPTAGAEPEAQADTPPAVDGVEAPAAVDGVEAPPAVEAVEVKADPAQGAAPAQDRDVPIDQIDEMLAKSAEQAIQQEAPPPPQVPGTDEVLAAQAEAEARDRLEAEARRGPDPTPVQPDPVGEAVEVEPQPVPIQGASATDVAKELDEDTQARPAEPAPVAEAEAQPQAAAPVAVQRAAPAAVVVVKTRHLRKAERALRLVCGKVNRPLNRLSPEMRDTVGYIGVVTTGLALFIFVYGLLF